MAPKSLLDFGCTSRKQSRQSRDVADAQERTSAKLLWKDWGTRKKRKVGAQHYDTDNYHMMTFS
eukprot:4730459-Amphidinium_carterae.1